MIIIIRSSSWPVARSLDIHARPLDLPLAQHVLAILFPHLAETPTNVIKIAYDNMPSGQAAPSSFTTVTVTVNLPHNVFGKPAGSDLDFSRTATSSVTSSKRATPSGSPSSSKKPKFSVDPAAVAAALLAAADSSLPSSAPASVPGPAPLEVITASRDHAKDRATFQKPLAAHTMVRDSCCVVTRNPMDSFLDCAYVLPPAVAVTFFVQPGAPIPAGVPTVNTVASGPDSTPSYDVRNAMMLSAGLHKGYDCFEWSIVGRDGLFSVFVFAAGLSEYDGRRLRFPPLIEGAAPRHATFYQDRFPDARTFRHHFEECVRRWFRAEGAEEDEPDIGTAGATALASAPAAEPHADETDHEDDPGDFMYLKSNAYESDTDNSLQEIFRFPGKKAYDSDSDYTMRDIFRSAGDE
ncbi:hypothetical protein HDU87_002042 [Geranomyces variabilis]|uniref:Uncharacterized protein n=1 Tax=Geranomyces variabilis TaxID=109894 RepID=A0AAD5XRP1_9FUNG|nr:hypothetical protein HDU87_002042 [Geranomyces variabilis]